MERTLERQVNISFTHKTIVLNPKFKKFNIFVLFFVYFFYHYCRSEEWQDVSEEERNDLGLTFGHDGEFW